MVKPFLFPKRKDLKDFLLTQAKSQNIKIDHLQYVFCSDDYVLNLNQQFLNHNDLTDILTFPYSDINQPLNADIYISLHRLKENASIHHNSFYDELLRVIFHGYLHLVGMPDKTPEQKTYMRIAEEQLIKSFKNRFT